MSADGPSPSGGGPSACLPEMFVVYLRPARFVAALRVVVTKSSSAHRSHTKRSRNPQLSLKHPLQVVENRTERGKTAASWSTQTTGDHCHAEPQPP